MEGSILLKGWIVEGSARRGKVGRQWKVWRKWQKIGGFGSTGGSERYSVLKWWESGKCNAGNFS